MASRDRTVNPALAQEPDDAALLTAIAQKRDRDAFAELFQRYQDIAFSYAVKILQDSALAQDAIQDAMLSIWVSPPAIRLEGDVRGWILRIVANKSLYLKRSRRRQADRLEHKAMEQAGSQPTVADGMEKKESIAALQNEIDCLPKLERTVLACTYCTNMSQQEIANLVGVSQRTVSNKIQQALDRLRINLAKAGVAAVIPLLTKEFIGEALTTGHACPPGMVEQLMARIAGHGTPARALSRRVGAAKHGSWIPIVIGTAAIASVLAILWAKSAQKSAPTIGPAPSVLTQAANPAPYRAFSRKWDFSTQQQADDFKVVEGRWHWAGNGGIGGSGCMEIDTDLLAVELPVPADTLPLLASVKICPLPPEPNTGFYAGVGWSNFQHAADFRNIWKAAAIPIGDWNSIRDYIAPGYIDRWDANNRHGLSVYTPTKASHLRLYVRGHMRMDDLEIQEISIKRLPDVSPYMDALDKIEPLKRKGTVILSKIPAAHASEPAEIVFAPESQ